MNSSELYLDKGGLELYHNKIVKYIDDHSSNWFKGTKAEVLEHYGISDLSELPEGTHTVVTDEYGAGGGYAEEVAYDGSSTGIAASDVQHAIDEVNNKFDGMHIKVLTQDEYDAIVNKDNHTLYYIV